jgi:flagellar basal-body rod protein FlgG
MNDAMYVAATGMQAQQSQLDVIANNVANVNTTTFKRSRVSFNDLVQRQSLEVANLATREVTQGAGVGISGIRKSFSVGELRRSDDPMSVAIQGAGFLEVVMADGSPAYTRGGLLRSNAEGLLSTIDGLALKQRVQMPNDSTQVSISPDGQVVAVDDRQREVNLGRIDTVVFANPSALVPIGDNLYRHAASAGDPLVTTPGESGGGRLMQGFEEASNVKLIDEMVQLMIAQRAYEMNVKVIQTSDELAGMVNNLRK